jgi:hypothetical protein
MVHRLFLILLVTALPALAQDKPAKEPAAAPGHAAGKPTEKPAAMPRAEDTPAADPAALVTARKAYEAKVKAVVDPLKADYLKKLESMKKDFGAKGDVAAALAVQREIDNLSEAGTATIVGKWDGFPGAGIAEFKADGTAKDISGNITGKWACLDKKTRRYQTTWSNGWVDWYLMSADGTTLTVAGHKNNQVLRYTVQKLPDP